MTGDAQLLSANAKESKYITSPTEPKEEKKRVARTGYRIWWHMSKLVKWATNFSFRLM
jgi:hypothetical protein